MNLVLTNIAYLEAVTLMGIGAMMISLKPGYRNTIGWPIMLAAIAIPVLCFLSPSLFLLQIVFIFFVPLLSLKWNQFGPIYTFALIVIPFIRKDSDISGVYILTYSIAYSLSIGAFLYVSFKEGYAKSRLIYDIPFFLIIFLFLVINGRDGSITNFARAFLSQGLDYLLPYLIVSRSIKTPAALRNHVLAVAAASVAMSAVALFEVWRSWPLYRAVWDLYDANLGSGGSVKVRDGLLRAAGPYDEPTSFAFFLAIGATAVIIAKASFKTPIHFLFVGGVAVLGLVSTQSRGAWLGLATAILALDLFRNRIGPLMRNLVLIAIAGAVWTWSSPQTASQTKVVNAAEAGSLAYRDLLLKRGIEEFWERPLFGDGPLSVVARMSDLRQGEGLIDFVNTYLYVALTAGGLGLLVFAGSLAAIAIGAFGAVRRRFPHGDDTNAFVFAAMCAIVVMLAFTSWGRNGVTFAIVAGIATAARNLVHQSPRKSAQKTPRPIGVAAQGAAA